MSSRDAQKIISLEEGWGNNIKPNAINILEDHLNRVSRYSTAVKSSVDILFRLCFGEIPLTIAHAGGFSREPNTARQQRGGGLVRCR